LYLIGYGYEQAATVSLAATVEWLANTTGTCTSLDSNVTIMGSSEGGYAAAWSARAIHGLGWNVLSSHLIAPPLNQDIQSRFLIETIDKGLIDPDLDNSEFPGILPLIAYSNSNEFPDLPNTGSGQIVLSSDWTVESNFSRDVRQWLSAPDPVSGEELLELIPPEDELLSLANPDFVSLYLEGIAGNVSEPCSLTAGLRINGTTDLLCETLTQASLWPVLKEVTFPTFVCFSPNDTIVTIDNFPPTLFESNAFVTAARTLPGSSIPIAGDHGVAIILCGLGPLSLYANPLPNISDTYNAIVPLPTDQEGTCRGNVEATEAPVSPSATSNIPTAAPQEVSSSSTWLGSSTLLVNIMAISGLSGFVSSLCQCV
jgi:hypothetical protein